MRPEQERVKNLLLDTVTLLCRNGLTYRCELKIQGLLGITLDDEEVFVVHINEKISDNIDNIHDTNRIDVDPTPTDTVRTGNDLYNDLIFPSVDQPPTQPGCAGSAQNADNDGVGTNVVQQFEDITSESGAPDSEYVTNPIDNAALGTTAQETVSERLSLKFEQNTARGAKEERPMVYRSTILF